MTGPHDHIRLRHLLEQGGPIITAHAPLVREYYEALVRQGFGEEHAFALTRDFHAWWVKEILADQEDLFGPTRPDPHGDHED